MSVRLRTRRSAAVLLGAALLAAATACGPTDNSVATSPKSTAAAPAAGGGGGSAPAADAKAPAVAKTGDTIALKGTEKGNTADVTVVKVVDNAKGADEYTRPAAGKRYVTVQFRIKATGTAAYSDSPHNSAKLVDSQGQNFEATIAETDAGPEFPVPLAIAPGDSALGCVTFEVPADAKLDKAQFTLDSGFAQQAGQWKLS
ncbi:MULTISPECIES: DUF4352 domain-containing protein [Kitasatospora]|uniref:DUF4352 domain-containing protein n=1 Tax=Kitasatospora setae (strain ATCC 33774 / DSM 43861 / JCM 3304 / KCC A-0304 / NBRC 14216 / KM-6054) TaxID=452652 RepID=E4NG15_KITSK|nr:MULTISPECIES: DUF4352 domain-containing protein [Kitasatospora]BAJ30445.1 hypothetical protein KSE_46640 [Kitasatospora setae KM-6054]